MPIKNPPMLGFQEMKDNSVSSKLKEFPRSREFSFAKILVQEVSLLNLFKRTWLPSKEILEISLNLKQSQRFASEKEYAKYMEKLTIKMKIVSSFFLLIWVNVCCWFLSQVRGMKQTYIKLERDADAKEMKNAKVHLIPTRSTGVD